MNHRGILTLAVCPMLLGPLIASRGEAQAPSEQAQRVASYAASTYFDAAVATLADLVAFRTVQLQGIPNARHPAFRALSAYLERKATELGLDFEDHGAVVVIGLGDSRERFGLITHADVQPADPTKWAQDPFSLDTTSEPTRLIGRGVEDDKGPIATVLYAMKAVKDHGVTLGRRIELVVSYTEESNWRPFQEFLAKRPPPRINVALDAEYPVVTAEKAWNAIMLSLPPAESRDRPRIVDFKGGVFLSQIPEDAEATIIAATPEIETALRRAAQSDTAVTFSFASRADSLVITARGRSAHSSKPWDGENAITHLAALLGAQDWPPTQAAHMVRLINDLVGTGDYGEQFGDLAYTHPFMGPLTLSLTTLERQESGKLVAGINVRSPEGQSGDRLDRKIHTAVDHWKEGTGIDVELSTMISAPYYLKDAPHIPTLVDIFRFYSGREAAGPIAIGGGTHARLVPNGVNFGPAMPGEPYTGHSEHEYMTREQYLLNLRMYTAMLVELAGAR